MTLIKSPSELDIRPTIKALFYGEPGIGKTTMALSAPNPLLIDCDGGVHRVSPEHRTPTVQVQSWEDINAVLSEDLTRFDTIVIDTAGKMLEFIEQNVAKKPKMAMANGMLQLQGYGLRNSMFKTFVSKVSLLGKNLIFVAHSKSDVRNDAAYFTPDIGGKNGDTLYKELDLMGYMFMSGQNRVICFNPSDRYYAKNSCKLPDVVNVADLSNSSNNAATGFIEAYAKHLEQGRELAKKRDELVNSIKSQIGAVDSIDGLNAFVDWQKDLKHIQDSKIQAREALRVKAAELGASYDKDEGVYCAV